jgi:hypothetical protein
MSAELVEGQLVAVFSTTDKYSFWMGRALGPVFAVEQEVLVCPGTQCEYKKGSRIFKVRYYDRVSVADRHARMFVREEEEYFIAASTLRCAGDELEAAFSVKASDVRRTRGAPQRQELEQFELTVAMHDGIRERQRVVFHDFE